MHPMLELEQSYFICIQMEVSAQLEMSPTHLQILRRITAKGSFGYHFLSEKVLSVHLWAASTFGPLAIPSGNSLHVPNIQHMAGQIDTFPAISGDLYHEDLINSSDSSLYQSHLSSK